MRIAARIRSWLSAILHRPRTEREMDAELRFHLESRAEDLVRAGLPREEALRRARIEFGAIESTKEECREARGSNLLESLMQDLRFGLRMLRKSPGFTAVAVLTLALGIGANTAIFSVVYDVLLRPLPYAHPEQLVCLYQSKLQDGMKMTGSSYLDLEEWRGHNQVFSELAGAQRHDLTLTGRGDPSVVDTVVLTPEAFSLLQEKPLAGRTFLPEDGNKGAAPVVILSESLWRERFGADPGVVGTSVNLDQRSFTIIGVMPADFRVPLFTERQQIWIPLAQDPLFGGWMPRRGGHWLRVMGRLKPDVSLAQAQAEMDGLSARLAQEYPDVNAGWSVRVTPLQQILVGNVKTALLVLLGAVGLVLLLACVNIANLLLARATSRAREVALRQALGAAHGRILRQLLTESALLGSLGAVAGILLAYWGVHALGAFLPPELPQFNPIRVDAWVLCFALLLSLAASLVFGLAPALLPSRSSTHTNLQEGASRSGEGGGRRRARRVLAAVEIALAVVLIVAAGLLARSFLSLTSVNPGFNPERVLKAEVSLPQYQYSTPQQWTAFSSALLERVQAQPGLRDSALAVPLPLADGYVNLGFSIPGAPPLPPGTPATADYVSVSPEYFRVLGIPLLRGRAFTPADAPSTPRVAVISEAFAQMYFPNQDPVGKHLVFGFPPNTNVTREIVGIVGDVRDVGLQQEPGPMMYVPFAQEPFWGGAVVTKTTLAPSTAFSEIRQVVQGIDKNLPVTDAGRFSDAIATTVAQPRFRAWLLGLFGVVALLLATAGIFGVISYSVSCRTQEFGVRIALGATPRAIRGMVLRESLRLAAFGLAAGILASLALAQFLKSQLYGVGVRDPLTFVATAILLLAVALAAGYIPARRATRVDPLVALRYE
jgi:putative ABC transport system permease protein